MINNRLALKLAAFASAGVLLGGVLLSIITIGRFIGGMMWLLRSRDMRIRWWWRSGMSPAPREAVVTYETDPGALWAVG